MKKIYAEIGGTGQQKGGELPNGYVEVNEPRPSNNHIGDASGVWVLGPTRKQYSSREFAALFTQAELEGIYNHAETVIDTRIWIDQVMGADFIDTTDTLTVNGMAYAVYQGLITQARHDEILG